MRKPYKNPLIIFSAIALVLLAGVVAMSVVDVLRIGETFIKPLFERDFFSDFFKIFSSDKMTLGFFIGGVVVVLADLALMAIAIIFIKRPLITTFAIVLCFLSIFGPFILAFEGGDLFDTLKVSFSSRHTFIKAIILTIYFSLIGLEFIFVNLAIIFAIKHSKTNVSSYSSFEQASDEPNPAPIDEEKPDVIAAPVVDSAFEEVEVEPVPVFTPEPELEEGPVFTPEPELEEGPVFETEPELEEGPVFETEPELELEPEPEVAPVLEIKPEPRREPEEKPEEISSIHKSELELKEKPSLTEEIAHACKEKEECTPSSNNNNVSVAANVKKPNSENVAPTPIQVESPAPKLKEEPKVKNNTSISGLDLANLTALLKEAVRDIVRDEIARSNANHEKTSNPVSDSHIDNHSIVGATFGGPLVVQYFNGGIDDVKPSNPHVIESTKPAVEEKPVPVEAIPASAPTSIEAKPAPTPVPMAKEAAPIPVPVKVGKASPVSAIAKPVEPKAPIIRIPFEKRITTADKEMQDNYNEIKNEILSWGVKSRVSNSGDTFRLHCKTYIKLTIAGKSLKLYFALNPDDYRDSKIPVQNAGNKNIYSEIPLIFKVKSGLSMRRCKELIQDVMEKDGLEQGEVNSINWVKEIKATLKAK